jgi:hypothetical protein
VVVTGIFSGRARGTASRTRRVVPHTALRSFIRKSLLASKSIELVSEGGYFVCLGSESPLEFPNFVPESIGSSLQAWNLVVVAVQSMETLLKIV